MGPDKYNKKIKQKKGKEGLILFKSDILSDKLSLGPSI